MNEALSEAPAISARGLARDYSGGRVLDLAELTVKRRSLGVLVGPNGAGKTTLLRLIAGLEKPDAGELSVLGSGWNSGPAETLALRRRIGFAAQRPYLLKTSVQGNVEYPLKARGLGRRERAVRARAALERLKVTHLAARHASTLSAGEAQRVAIARAVSPSPELLLLDEPLANLDPAATPLVEELCRELAGRGVTVMVATHILDLAYRLSAQVIRLEKGKLAPPALENLLEGELEMLEDGSAALAVSSGPRLFVAASRAGEVRAAIDPKDIVISIKPLESSARNSLPGRVTKLEDREGTVRVTADAGIPLVATITRRSLDELKLKPGSDVFLTFKATAVRIF